MDSRHIVKSPILQGGGQGNFTMPPPPVPPLGNQRQMQPVFPNQASPHFATTGGSQSTNIFQFSDAHIGMQNTEKEESLAHSSSPHASPLAVPQYNPRSSNAAKANSLRFQQNNVSDAMLGTITSYNDNEMLSENSFEVGTNLNMENEMLHGSMAGQQNQSNSDTFDLFANDNDYSMDSQQDLDLSSPQNFSDGSNTYGVSDNSNPLSGLQEQESSGK